MCSLGDKNMSKLVKKNVQIKPGDIYENCNFQPCICMGVDGDDVWGISLIDGSYPWSCSIAHCAIRKLTPQEAYTWKISGPPDFVVDKEHQWW